MYKEHNKVKSGEKDIVLLQLHLPAIYSSHVFPACVPDNTTKVPTDSLCWISGWGMLSDESEYTGQDRRGRGTSLEAFPVVVNPSFWFKSKAPPITD